MDNTNDKELLDQYLRGKLSSVEQLNLEKRLATDISLANQLADLDEVQQGIRLARLASVLEEVQDWEREAAIQERIKSHQIGWHWWGMAASIALLLGVAWFTFQPNEPALHEKLFEEYFEPYPAIGIIKSEIGTNIETQQRGLLYYQNKNYKKAIPLLKKGIEKDRFLENHLYIGISYLESNLIDSARIHLARIDQVLKNLSFQTIVICLRKLNN